MGMPNKDDAVAAVSGVQSALRKTFVPRRLVAKVMDEADAYMKDTDAGRAILGKLYGPHSRGGRRNIMLTAKEMDYLNAICLHNAI